MVMHRQQSRSFPPLPRSGSIHSNASSTLSYLVTHQQQQHQMTMLHQKKTLTSGSQGLKNGCKGGDYLYFSRPAPNKLFTADVPLSLLFSRLSMDIVIKVFEALLLERSVALFSKHLSLLTPCCEAFRSLLFPIQLCMVYIPLLPPRLLEILTSPIGFFVGVPNKDDTLTKCLRLSPSALMVDLDSNQILTASTASCVISMDHFTESSLGNASMGFRPIPNSDEHQRKKLTSRIHAALENVLPATTVATLTKEANSESIYAGRLGEVDGYLPFGVAIYGSSAPLTSHPSFTPQTNTNINNNYNYNHNTNTKNNNGALLHVSSTLSVTSGLQQPQFTSIATVNGTSNAKLSFEEFDSSHHLPCCQFSDPHVLEKRIQRQQRRHLLQQQRQHQKLQQQHLFLSTMSHTHSHQSQGQSQQSHQYLLRSSRTVTANASASHSRPETIILSRTQTRAFSDHVDELSEDVEDAPIAPVHGVGVTGPSSQRSCVKGQEEFKTGNLLTASAGTNLNVSQPLHSAKTLHNPSQRIHTVGGSEEGLPLHMHAEGSQASKCKRKGKGVKIQKQAEGAEDDEVGFLEFLMTSEDLCDEFNDEDEWSDCDCAALLTGRLRENCFSTGPRRVDKSVDASLALPHRLQQQVTLWDCPHNNDAASKVIAGLPTSPPLHPVCHSKRAEATCSHSSTSAALQTSSNNHVKSILRRSDSTASSSGQTYSAHHSLDAVDFDGDGLHEHMCAANGVCLPNFDAEDYLQKKNVWLRRTSPDCASYPYHALSLFGECHVRPHRFPSSSNSNQSTTTCDVAEVIFKREKLLQESFFQYIVASLMGLDDFLRLDGTLNVDGMVKQQAEGSRAFYKEWLTSMSISDLVAARAKPFSEDVALAALLMKEAQIAKKNRSKLTLSKGDTPFLRLTSWDVDPSKTFFVPTVQQLVLDYHHRQPQAALSPVDELMHLIQKCCDTNHLLKEQIDGSVPFTEAVVIKELFVSIEKTHAADSDKFFTLKSFLTGPWSTQKMVVEWKKLVESIDEHLNTLKDWDNDATQIIPKELTTSSMQYDVDVNRNFDRHWPDRVNHEITNAMADYQFQVNGHVFHTGSPSNPNVPDSNANDDRRSISLILLEQLLEEFNAVTSRFVNFLIISGHLQNISGLVNFDGHAFSSFAARYPLPRRPSPTLATGFAPNQNSLKLSIPPCFMNTSFALYRSLRLVTRSTHNLHQKVQDHLTNDTTDNANDNGAHTATFHDVPPAHKDEQNKVSSIASEKALLQKKATLLYAFMDAKDTPSDTIFLMWSLIAIRSLPRLSFQESLLSLLVDVILSLLAARFQNNHRCPDSVFQWFIEAAAVVHRADVAMRIVSFMRSWDVAPDDRTFAILLERFVAIVTSHSHTQNNSNVNSNNNLYHNTQNRTGLVSKNHEKKKTTSTSSGVDAVDDRDPYLFRSLAYALARYRHRAPEMVVSALQFPQPMPPVVVRENYKKLNVRKVTAGHYDYGHNDGKGTAMPRIELETPQLKLTGADYKLAKHKKGVCKNDFSELVLNYVPQNVTVRLGRLQLQSFVVCAVCDTFLEYSLLEAAWHRQAQELHAFNQSQNDNYNKENENDNTMNGVEVDDVSGYLLEDFGSVPLRCVSCHHPIENPSLHVTSCSGYEGNGGITFTVPLLNPLSCAVGIQAVLLSETSFSINVPLLIQQTPSLYFNLMFQFIKKGLTISHLIPMQDEYFQMQTENEKSAAQHKKGDEVYEHHLLDVLGRRLEDVQLNHHHDIHTQALNQQKQIQQQQHQQVTVAPLPLSMIECMKNGQQPQQPQVVSPQQHHSRQTVTTPLNRKHGKLLFNSTKRHEANHKLKTKNRQFVALPHQNRSKHQTSAHQKKDTNTPTTTPVSTPVTSTSHMHATAIQKDLISQMQAEIEALKRQVELLQK